MGGWSGEGKDTIKWDGNIKCEKLNAFDSVGVGVEPYRYGINVLSGEWGLMLDTIYASQIGIGSGIQFKGAYGGPSHTGFAEVWGVKENALPGDDAGSFEIWTNVSEAGATNKKISVSSNGVLTNHLSYFSSLVATGTAPYQCSSTTLNTNLNADLLDGLHSSSFLNTSTDVTIAQGGTNASSFTASKLVMSNAAADTLISATTGTSMNITGETLNTIQGIRTTDSPQFANLILTGTGSVKPSADGTSAIRVANAAGSGLFIFDTTNARLGINTGAPSERLEISGTGANAILVGSTTTGSSNSASLGLKRGDTANGACSIVYKVGSSNEWLVGTVTGGSNFRFYDYGGTAGERISILSSSGNVGISDTAPAEKLDVNGNINCTGVYKVDDVQVVGNRVIDARCDDTINCGDATTDGVIDALRDAMIAHGLIAAA